MTVTIDLATQIDCLRGLKSDLDEAFELFAPDLSGPDRDGLSVAIGQMAQRVAAVEEIGRRASHQLKVDRLTSDELRALERALALLQGEFVLEDGLAPSTMWSRVRRLLAAVDEVLMTAARGVPVDAAKPAAVAGRGVVVALSRGAR